MFVEERSAEKKVLLWGFMGAGKSTVGRLLASRLRWPYVDLDHEIEQREQQDIPAIFARHGESYFREIERKALEEMLMKPEAFVLSSGGGTPCFHDNAALMLNCGIVFFLDVSFRTLIDRLKRDRVLHLSRPKLNSSRESWTEGVASLYTQRLIVYQEAHFHIEERSAPEDMVSDILHHLEAEGISSPR